MEIRPLGVGNNDLSICPVVDFSTLDPGIEHFQRTSEVEIAGQLKGPVDWEILLQLT